MSQGPWSEGPRGPGAPRRRPRVGLLAAIVVCSIGVVALWRLSDGRAVSADDWAYIGLRGLMLTLAVSALLSYGLTAKRTLKYALIWLGFGAVLLLGFSFREELGVVAARMGSEAAPGFAAETRPGELMVTRSADGAFYVMGQVNGRAVRFLIDTGASDIVLSPEDARRLGVDVDSLDFNRSYQTANGVGRGAGFEAQSLAVGPVRLRDVPMSINRAPMDASLLGMSFFRDLQSMEIRGDRLYLRWRT